MHGRDPSTLGPYTDVATADPGPSRVQAAQSFVQRSQSARRSAAHIFASAESDEVSS